MLFLSVILTGREYMNINPLKSLWCDKIMQTNQNIYIAHVCCDNDDLSHASQFTNVVIKQLKLAEQWKENRLLHL